MAQEIEGLPWKLHDPGLSVEFTKYRARQRCRRTKVRQSTNVGSPLQYQAVTGTWIRSIIETHFKSKQWMTCDFEERTASH